MAKPLERAIEAVFVAGLVASASLLLVGLAGGWGEGLRFGVALLLLTPIAGVVVLTVGLFATRDWLFGLVALFVLAVLFSGIHVSLRISRGAPNVSKTSLR
jgi:Protein of unknown function (DUF1634)